MAKTKDDAPYIEEAESLKTLSGANENPGYFEHRGNRKNMLKLINFVLLAAGSLLILSLLWWMISTSLKTITEVMSFPPAFFPESWNWASYRPAWESAPFTQYSIHTLSISPLVVIAIVLSNSFMTFGFA